MRIVTEAIDIPRGARVMRAFVARPAEEGRFPALAFYSDIFQITPSTRRMAERFAGYGFVVAAPDIYWRYEPPGEAWAFDDAGRDRGNLHVRNMHASDFDDDIAALLAAMASWPFVRPSGIGAVGFCTGGHVAVRATVCFYPTGLHDGELTGDADAGTLARLREIHGELLLIFGTLDPHTPAAGRELVTKRLEAAGIRQRVSLYEAEHAFMRDEGPRYDPERTDQALTEAMSVLNVLRSPE